VDFCIVKNIKLLYIVIYQNSETKLWQTLKQAESLAFKELALQYDYHHSQIIGCKIVTNVL
jgi:hypothetical protein